MMMMIIYNQHCFNLNVLISILIIIQLRYIIVIVMNNPRRINLGKLYST